MANADLPPVAIIADAHFHDMLSDYGCDGITIDKQQLTLRSWTDTRRSSRVFNESKAALQWALHDIHSRGIKHVVLLGDYSDDGQIEATERLVDLLRYHRDQYGTQFFAITGNHDAYGPLGKHQSTRFVDSTGDTVLVTSDPKVAATEPDSAVLSNRMYCEGVAKSVLTMSDFGLFRRSHHVHWESPFGASDSLENRQYVAQSADGQSVHRLVDASYLVEPVDGLWLLMLDANVFEPRNGQWKPSQKKAFLDSSDAGWNSVLRNKPHLLDWINDVCTRARQAGKTLLAFSHYPIIDPFADPDKRASRLFGDHEMLRRQPKKAIADKLMQAGIRLHFSGHLHVNALSSHTDDSLIIEDCAVPSLVAFPACYKVVHTASAVLRIDAVTLSSMPLDARLMQVYKKENAINGYADTATLAASAYDKFLYLRMHSRVINHLLSREWPKDIAQSVLNTTAADLALFMSCKSGAADRPLIPKADVASADVVNMMQVTLAQHGINLATLAECSMTQLVSDWYCLRHAGHLARTFISPDNLRIYCYLADRFGDLEPISTTTHKAFFSVFLGMLKLAISRSDPSDTREQVLLA